MCIHRPHPKGSPGHRMSAQTGEQAAGGVQENPLSSESFTYFLRIHPWEQDCSFPGAGRGFLLQINQ